MRIDLHAHSTVSDGTDSPAELVRAARQAGLDVLAITDHDTTAGWGPAVAALPAGLTLVRGAELSCVVLDDGVPVLVHLLAYLFDPSSPEIVAEQQRLRIERRARLYTMAQRMAANGLPVDADEILAAMPENFSAGRPHLAQVLVRAGLVETVDEAFARYLTQGRRYYLPRQDTPVEQAISMIAAAGGVTVLAHPRAPSRGPQLSNARIAELADYGLTGIEVDHFTHDHPARARLRELADALNLVRTGSSDYHGTNKTVRLGQETTDPEQFERLVSQASATPLVTGPAVKGQR
jgi:hypothetical protein